MGVDTSRPSTACLFAAGTENMATGECWICRGAATKQWKARNIPTNLVPDDLKITDAHYGRTLRLLRCEACGFIFADAEELEQLSALYGQLVDDGYTESSEARTLQMSRIL